MTNFLPLRQLLLEKLILRKPNLKVTEARVSRTKYDHVIVTGY